MVDHYKVLGVDKGASEREIKRAFWKLAKKFHPDKNPGNEKYAEKMFRQIRESYEILMRQFSSSSTQDQSLRSQPNKTVRSRKKDITTLCRLVLEELINHNNDYAIGIYEDLVRKEPGFSFDRYMDDADVRDCEFLLAEAYHMKGDLTKASQLYEKVLCREKEKAYFHFFADEIRSMLRDVYVTLIKQSKDKYEIIEILGKIENLGASNKKMAWVYKKTAESLYDIGEKHWSMYYLRKAFIIDPKLKGAKKISKKLMFMLDLI